MDDDARLEELLLRWEELRREGNPATATELCRDCPELLEQLKLRVEALEAMNHSMHIDNQPQNPDGFGHLIPFVPDGYELVEKLGKGHFGEVCKALNSSRRPMALKFVRLDDEDSKVELKALDLMMRMDVRHPHLVEIIETRERRPYLVIVMQLADKSLLKKLEEERAKGHLGIGVPEILKYFEEAAEAVDYLHREKSLHHRDVKPANLLLVGNCVRLTKRLRIGEALGWRSRQPHRMGEFALSRSRMPRRGTLHASAIGPILAGCVLL
jgi:hypothetical protein